MYCSCIQRAIPALLFLAASVLCATAGTAQEFTLTVSVIGNGTTDPPPGTHTYDEGEFVFITATPDVGWAFDRWDGDYSGEESTLIVEMTFDTSVTAVFVEGGYPLTIAVTGNGQTIPAPGTHTYVEGRVVQIMASPDLGYRLDRWEGDASGSDDIIWVTMDGPKSITAVFV
ncbi:MAG TPA: hypothetical protein PKL84_11730, partial [Candidatus Hydrogenedentes bacterium]|nr:hypothetical protein [Candidatus Hydrogenedentota bacterium]